jgi:hypothetical protein
MICYADFLAPLTLEDSFKHTLVRLVDDPVQP